jgi:hypothetical protein
MQEQQMHHDPGEAKRLYVIVRADIPTGYQMAQSCHAAAAIGADQPLQLSKFPTIVILSAYNLKGLEVLHKLTLREHAANDDPLPVPFYEPDLNDEMTAFAVFADGGLFRHLELAGGGKKPKRGLFGRLR